MRIKICGITRLQDAQAAVDCGADALGFNAYPKSLRYIKPDAVSEIVAQLNPRTAIVGVFVRGYLDGVDADFWDAIQLHGYASEDDLPRLSVPIYAAVSAKDVAGFPSTKLIIDESWGRGVRVEWSKLANFQRQFVLSGGLDPDNISEAIAACSPVGVDVCSGVESSPGIKDHERTRLFVKRADIALKEIEKSKVQK